MNLRQALRLPGLPRLALVGSGGKTTALFQLAKEIEGPVWLSASTHLGVNQADRARQHLIVRRPRLLKYALQSAVQEGITLFTGEQQGSRLAGLDSDSLQILKRAADERQIPLLIEADGSRSLPLKAPGDHEPPIPPWIEQVVLVAGMSGLNKILDENWVHRPERFSQLSGCPLGERIRPVDLASVLSSEKGGRKNIPPGARRVVLLNQIDMLENITDARELAKLLVPSFNAVLAASLSGANSSNSDDEVAWAHERRAGIVLAAGGSQRLNRPKQLLTWRGEPFVRRCAKIALAAGFDSVYVITGAHELEVVDALRFLPLRIVNNPEWESGQSSSVRCAIRALPDDVSAAAFLLVDQPQIDVTLLRAITELHSRTLSPLTSPRVGNRRANPVLFDRVTFPELLLLRGDQGGRQLFDQFPVAWVDWEDDSILLDVDTPQDYLKLIDYE